jgi:hypothetical protein
MERSGIHVLEIYFQYVEITVVFYPMFLEIRNIFPILTNEKPLCWEGLYFNVPFYLLTFVELYHEVFLST